MMAPLAGSDVRTMMAWRIYVIPYSLNSAALEGLFFCRRNASHAHILGFALFQPRIDEKHEKWLHLRIRPSTLPFLDSEKHRGKTKKYLVDGRWTLAFSDEQSCKAAEVMVIKEMKLQQDAVGKQLQPLVEFDMPEDGLQHPQPSLQDTPSDDGS